MAKRILKESFSVRAILILLVILIISLYISSGYLAKFITNTSDSDGARVASYTFNINNNTALALDLSSVNAPGTSQTYTFTVVSPNTNEVARNYNVLIKTTNNLPLTLTLADSTPTTLASTTATVATGIAYQLSDSGNIAANTAFSRTYTLTVSWPAAQTSPNYSSVVDVIMLEVTGTQID